ncbi:CapA family protein [Rhizobium leguminosarum]
MLRNTRQRKQLAECCIVANHGHEPGNRSRSRHYDNPLSAKWPMLGSMRNIVHGPHQQRGIEIYKGRAILYSVGNFGHQQAPTCSQLTARTRTHGPLAEIAQGYETDAGFTDPIFT